MDKNEFKSILNSGVKRQEEREGSVTELDTYVESLKDEIRRFQNVNKNYTKDDITAIIDKYVEKSLPDFQIKRFIKNDNIQKGDLIQYLNDYFFNFGILQPLIDSKKYDEIGSIGRWIYYSSNGQLFWAYDSKTKERLKFNSPEEQLALLNRLFISNNTYANNTYRYVNGRTIQGDRLSITHYSAKSLSKDNPLENGYCDFTLRKFKEETLTVNKMIAAHSLSKSMWKLLSICSKHVSYAIVGKPFSGKTTLNRLLIDDFDPNKKLIYIQQPTEHDNRKYNKKGELINFACLWEADEDIATAYGNDPNAKYLNTLPNAGAHTLRNSPDVVCINEVRFPDEFYIALQIGQTGYPINLTFHADNEQDACSRYSNNVIAISNQVYELALKDITSVFKLIVHQQLLNDGTRKILGISEVIGSDGINPILNKLYEFKPNRNKIEVDEDGVVISIGGEHVKVGMLSEELKNKLYLAGVTDEQMKLIDPPVGTKQKYDED